MKRKVWNSRNIVKGVLEYDGRLSKYSSGEERTEEYQRFAEEYANLQKTRDGRNFLKDCVNYYEDREKVD